MAREYPGEYISTITKEAWEAFEEMAIKNGLGEEEEDWMPWYDFFVAGYEAGVRDM